MRCPLYNKANVDKCKGHRRGILNPVCKACGLWVAVEEERQMCKRLHIINGVLRCTVYINRLYKKELDEIYNEDDIKMKFILLRKLHETCDDSIKQYILKASLMLYHVENESNFIKVFNQIEEMLDMPAAIIIECKLGEYK